MRNALERSRYAQIALTYTMPWPLRIWAIVTTIFVLWVLLEHGEGGARIAMLFLGGTMAVCVGAMITAHAKDQLADARSSLTPHFRTPHLVIAATLFIVAVGGLTLLVGWRTSPLPWDYGGHDLWLPGYLALVLIVTAAMAWMSHVQSPLSVMVIMLLITPVCFASGRAMLNDIARGRSEELGYIILAVAVAALVALWARLALLHAEMPEYARTMGPGFRLRVQMTGDPGFRRENAAGSGAIEAWVRRANQLDEIASVAGAAFWRRVRHWRIVIGLGRTAMLVALVLGLWSYIMPQIAGGMRDRHSRVVLPVVLSALVPGLMVAAVWPRRWYMLADESLRPASRRQFVREQGVAMATELAVTWLTITAALVAAALLLEQSLIRLAPLWRALPLVVSAQILIFGVIVWVMRYRSGWLVVVPIFLATFTGIGVLVIGGSLAQLERIQPMLIAAFVFAAAGVAITLDAHRRWLVTEFD